MTLAGVEQASRRFPEPIAVDYLSRLERGTFMPSVPKLATLANVYQRHIKDFVDLYELEPLKSLVPPQEGDFWHFRKMAIEAAGKGDNRSSAAAFLRGLDAARASGEVDTIAQALTSVGVSLIRLDRYHAAQDFLEEALACVRNDRVRGYALHGLALIYWQFENFFLAEFLVGKAVEYVGEDLQLRSMILSLRGAIHSEQGRHDLAVECFRDAWNDRQQAGDEHFAIREMTNLSINLVKAQRVDEGLNLFRDVMARAAETGDPYLRADSTLQYGKALYELGRYEDAIPALKSAFLIAKDRAMYQQAFYAAFYLWKLSDERGFPIEGDWEGVARRYRPEVEQRFWEVREFDASQATALKKPHPGRKPKNLM